MVQVHERMFVVAQAEYPLVKALGEYEGAEGKTPDDMAVLVSNAIARFLNGLQVADDQIPDSGGARAHPWRDGAAAGLSGHQLRHLHDPL